MLGGSGGGYYKLAAGWHSCIVPHYWCYRASAQAVLYTQLGTFVAAAYAATAQAGMHCSWQQCYLVFPSVTLATPLNSAYTTAGSSVLLGFL